MSAATGVDLLQSVRVVYQGGQRIDMAEAPPAPVVVVDEPARLFWASENDYWNIHSDFGPLLPPFDATWVTYRQPRLVHASGGFHEMTGRSLDSHIAAYVTRRDMEEDCHEVNLRFFIVGPRGGQLLPVGLRLKVDPMGRCERFEFAVLSLFPDCEDTQNPMARAAEDFGKAILFGLSLMHCKNIERQQIEPDLAVSKKWQRKKNRQPLVAHVRIKLPGGVVTSDAKATKKRLGGVLPMHLVRGHFKTFTEDAPLFGTRTGTYWWGWQARGKKEAGERLHTYEVQP